MKTVNKLEIIGTTKVSDESNPLPNYNYTNEYYHLPRHPFTGMPFLPPHTQQQMGYPNFYPPPYIPYPLNAYPQHNAQYPLSPEQLNLWYTRSQIERIP
ncbi:MAG: hypothetical protein MUD01_16660, partial [Chloroflexaceae bacterium]|nr:hypothetical protein [Chloroflexaceae bacterium]